MEVADALEQPIELVLLLQPEARGDQVPVRAADVQPAVLRAGLSQAPILDAARSEAVPLSQLIPRSGLL